MLEKSQWLLYVLIFKQIEILLYYVIGTIIGDQRRTDVTVSFRFTLHRKES